MHLNGKLPRKTKSLHDAHGSTTKISQRGVFAEGCLYGFGLSGQQVQGRACHRACIIYIECTSAGNWEQSPPSSMLPLTVGHGSSAQINTV